MKTGRLLKTSLLAGILALGTGGCDGSSRNAGPPGSGGVPAGGATSDRGGANASTSSGAVPAGGASSGMGGAESSGGGGQGTGGAGGSSARAGSSTRTGGLGSGGSGGVGDSTARGGTTGSGGTTARSTGSAPGSGGGTGGRTNGATGGRASGGSGGGLPATGGQAGTGGASITGSGSGTAAAGGTTKSAGCGSPEGLKSGRATIDVSGSAREYILKMPGSYDGNRPYKLIFGFHARGGNATQVAGSGNDNYYGLASRAGDSAIFVAPEGLDAGWRNSDGRDIAFVKAMLAFFNSKLCIDQQRIFSTGFSFGGMMSDAIGCAMADVFRAIAPMAGGLPNAEHPYSGCDQVNDHPIAVWMSHGDNDTVVPIADGKAALDIFVKRSQCQAQTSSVTPSPCVAYQGCLAGYPIHWCKFAGGHAVPDFASKAIWDFFSQF